MANPTLTLDEIRVVLEQSKENLESAIEEIDDVLDNFPEEDDEIFFEDEEDENGEQKPIPKSQHCSRWLQTDPFGNLFNANDYFMIVDLQKRVTAFLKSKKKKAKATR